MKDYLSKLAANALHSKRKIVLLYAVFGFGILFASSLLINSIDNNYPETNLRYLHHYKYSLFILITALVLYVLLGTHYHNLSVVEGNYIKLFEGSPGAVYVMDKINFHFLAVNDVMIKKYGYSREQLLKMSALDIRPEEEREKLRNYLNSEHDEGRETGIWRHKKENGELFYVLISHHSIKFQNEDAYVVIAIDIDKNIQNERRLREIAWANSHEIRKPLSNILGLTAIMKSCDPMTPLDTGLIAQLDVAANELDTVVKKINQYAESLDQY